MKLEILDGAAEVWRVSWLWFPKACQDPLPSFPCIPVVFSFPEDEERRVEKRASAALHFMSGIATATPGQSHSIRYHIQLFNSRKGTEVGRSVKPTGISLRMDLREPPCFAHSKYTSAWFPCHTHRFHDASTFPVQLQVLTRGQTQNVMWCKCVSMFTCPHTVSYKEFNFLPTELIIFIELWDNSFDHSSASFTISL